MLRSSREILNSGYSNHGANTSKAANRGYITDSKDARHDIDNNFKMLRARSVDLQQGIPIAAGALKTNKTNVIGPGLKLKANIRFEALGSRSTKKTNGNVIPSKSLPCGLATATPVSRQTFTDYKPWYFLKKCCTAMPL